MTGFCIKGTIEFFCKADFPQRLVELRVTFWVELRNPDYLHILITS